MPRSRTRTGRAREDEHKLWPKNNKDDKSLAKEDGHDNNEPSDKEEGKLWTNKEEEEDNEP